jgi:DNA-binding CsgD family transcriptional regulator
VDILTSADDLVTARVAMDELSRISEQFHAPAVRALAAHATGAVCLAEGALPAALSSLREAWTLWQELEVPYEAARARVLLGQVCQQLGDPVAADFEFDGARRFFQRVSNPTWHGRHAVSMPAGPARIRPPNQVFELVATGKTNREIARQLSISERTVDRHVSNILLKLKLPSRSAATAYAYEHDLIGRTG